MKRWGFVGAGKMATALVQGMLRARLAKDDAIVASDPLEGARTSIQVETGIAVFESNLDEFFMVRVGSLQQKVQAHIAYGSGADHMPVKTILEQIARRVGQMGAEAYRCLFQELLPGLEREEFRVVYQPIVGMDDLGVRGVEALVRWMHPTFGLLGPDQFIELAEETGAIVPLGRRVLIEACERAAEWNLAHPDEEMFISVNLAVRQAHDPDLVAQRILRFTKGVGRERVVMVMLVCLGARDPFS